MNNCLQVWWRGHGGCPTEVEVKQTSEEEEAHFEDSVGSFLNFGIYPAARSERGTTNVTT